MGRVVGFLGAVLYALRLVADGLLIARDLRGGGAQTEPGGDPPVGGPAEAAPPDGAGGVGPVGPPTGPTAREGAGPVSGPVTGG